MPTRPSLAILCATLTVLAATVVTARAQTTVLHFDSQPGDFIGQGQLQTYPGAQLSFDINVVHSTLHLSASTGNEFWNFQFTAPFAGALEVGSYAPVMGTFGSVLPVAGLRVGGWGRGCTLASGRFNILELVRDGSGTVLKFAADVEQRCVGSAGALFAAIRYNSAIVSFSPFGGDYPRFELRLTPPSNGTISGESISCGMGGQSCLLQAPAPTTVQLTAIAEPGYVFTGWTGLCHGGSTITVTIASVAPCGATFAPEPPVAPRSIMAVHSQTGDVAGLGRTELWNPTNSVWSVLASNGGGSISFSAVGFSNDVASRWSVRLTSPGGSPFAPGSYFDVVTSEPFFLPGIDVVGPATSCRGTGRFDVVEAEFAQDGSVVRFAADVEFHCDDNAPALYVALRHNSMVAGLLPFGSIAPRYELTIDPPSNGTVAGDGVACSSGGGACFVSFTQTANVALTATANPGYIFAGWTGACSGEASTTIRVTSIKRCGAVFQLRAPTQARTLVYIDGSQGDPVGQGRTLAYSSDNASISVSRRDQRTVNVDVTGVDGSWSFVFAGLPSQAVSPGVYAPARYASSLIALSISGHGRGCGPLTGRFVVHEIEYASDGSIVRFAADAEQHCQDQAPGLFAAIRFNSTRQPIPFNGQYPWYELTVSQPNHGRVAGGPLNCGAGTTSCWVAFLTPTVLTLTAIPDPGYTFVGWTGACSGGQTATLNVNSTMTCAALFEPSPPPAPRTVLFWESQTFDWIGDGEDEIYNQANSLWTVTPMAGDAGTGVDIDVHSISETATSKWSMRFRAVPGQPFAPGVYENASRLAGSPTQPGMDVSGNGRGCARVFGRFTVHELTRHPESGSITSLALDFEQRCESSSGPALFGTIRYNSAVPARIRSVSLQIDVTSPMRYGHTATWTASAHPSGGVEYSFWRQSNGGPWLQVQAYSTQPTYAWTPGPADIGSHSIQVFARVLGSAAPYDVWAGAALVVETGPLPTLRSVVVDRPPQVGASLTWTATADGGIGPLQYKFWRLHDGVWTMVRDYATSREYRWSPTASDLGGHTLQVWVRNADATTAYDAFTSVAFEVAAPPPLLVTSLTADKPSPAPAGGPITWTATASGGAPPLRYQFWRLDAGVWKMVQDYSSSSTFTWTPTPGDAGDHALQVFVRSSGSTGAYEAWRSAAITISGPAPVSVSSLVANRTSPVPAGVAIGWTATASGGVAPLEYQFWRLHAGTWTIAQAYSTSPIHHWTPGPGDVGDHALQVWVRSTGSTAVYEAWASASITITGPPPPVVTGLVATSSAEPLRAGVTVTWSAFATGGVAPLQYQFWRRDADGWKMVRDWSQNTLYTWFPTLADVGAHDLQVWVRSAGVTSGFEAWRGTSFVIADPGLSVQLAGTRAFPVSVSDGISVSWIASAQGGVAPLEYQFYRLDADGWKMVRDYSTNALYTWVPTAADVGTHAIQVFVRSAGSTNVYDAWTGSGLFVINP